MRLEYEAKAFEDKFIIMLDGIKVIAFDADDTLWVNEPFFQEIEKSFCELLQEYGTQKEISKELFRTEMQNLEIYGYGAKGFTLSLLETALRISKNTIPTDQIAQIIEMGKSLLTIPIQLLDGVEPLLKSLNGKFEVIMATKGDLLDQQSKLKRSGLEEYFSHVEIMSDKTEDDYMKLLSKLEFMPDEFLMIGNSLKSDIQPVLNIGGYGAYIPFHTVWQHEKIEEISHTRMIRSASLEELKEVLK